ncbi:MAG: YybH family protein [Solirubrobacterales bacterium]
MAESVEEAQEEFYAALNAMLTGDVGPMREIVSTADEATLAGPFGDIQTGGAMIAHFESEAGMEMGGEVEVTDLTIVGGEDMGYSICVENAKGLTIDGEERDLVHRATNVFRREDGGWKMIHHHTDGSIVGD